MPHEGGRASQLAVIAVLTNLRDSGSAFNLARELVDLRLAACANVLSPVTSFYRWEGKDEQATEYPVLIKSTRDRYPELDHWEQQASKRRRSLWNTKIHHRAARARQVEELCGPRKRKDPGEQQHGGVGKLKQKEADGKGEEAMVP